MKIIIVKIASNVAKSYNILEISLSVLYIYFDGPTKYFQICI